MRRARVRAPRPALRRLALVALVGTAVALGSDVGQADTAAPTLAPPGECAAPDPELITDTTQDLTPSFVVAGPPTLHFTPGDVAAEPPSFPLPEPGVPGGPRQGGCDAPDPGCVGSVTGLGVRGLVESPTQPGLPPGAGGE